MLSTRIVGRNLRRKSKAPNYATRRRHNSRKKDATTNKEDAVRSEQDPGISSTQQTPSRSLLMTLSLPQTRTFWETIQAASTTVKRMATSSSLRKNYFALTASERMAVAEILDTPATNNSNNNSSQYKDYTWLYMTLNRLAFMKDIQGNHLWKICKFQLGDFYKVAPEALESFHNVLGELQNEFPIVSKETFDRENKRIEEGLREAMIEHRGQHKKPTYAEREIPHLKIGEFLRNHWYEQALKDPTTSLAGELCQMVGHLVFNTTYSMSRRIAFELSQRNAQFRKGSCRVKRISVRSARTFWIPPDGTDRNKYLKLDEEEEQLQAYDDDESKPDVNYDSPSGVMVQIKLLYGLERTIEPLVAKSIDGRNDDDGTNNFLMVPEDEYYHCEATFEGWLHGGPEGTLQWRIIEFMDLNKTINT